MQNLLKNIFIEQTVSRLALRTAQIVAPEMMLSEALLLMRQYGGCVFVGARWRVDGIVTERDIVTRVGLPNLPVTTTPVSAVMTAQPKTVKRTSSLARAVQLMASGGCRHLLVENGAGVAPSMFSTQEAADFLYEHIAQQVVSTPSESEPQIGKASHVEKFFQDSISRLASTELTTILETLPLAQVLGTLVQKKMGSVIVTGTQGTVRGIFTERDFLMKAALGEHDLSATPVAVLMTKSPQTILQSGSIALAFSIMSQGGFRHLPVVDSLEKLVGIVSTRSLLVGLSDVIIAELNSSS